MIFGDKRLKSSEDEPDFRFGRRKFFFFGAILAARPVELVKPDCFVFRNGSIIRGDGGAGEKIHGHQPIWPCVEAGGLLTREKLRAFADTLIEQSMAPPGRIILPSWIRDGLRT